MRPGRSVCLETTQVGRWRVRKAAAPAGVEVLVRPVLTRAPPALAAACCPVSSPRGPSAYWGRRPVFKGASSQPHTAWARLLQVLAECRLPMGPQPRVTTAAQPHPLTLPSLPSGRDHAHCSRPVFVSASPAGMAAHEGGVCALPWWTQVPGTMPADVRCWFCQCPSLK